MLKFTGARLTAIRKDRGFSQSELARLARLTNGYISLLESDQRRPSLDNAQALADALGCTVIDLQQPTSSPIPPKAPSGPLQRVAEAASNAATVAAA